MQSLPVANAKAEKGQGIPRKLAIYADKETIDSPDPSIHSLFDNFNRGVHISGDKHGFGKRIIQKDGTAGPYVWNTYNEVAAMRDRISSAFLARGLKEQTMVGICADNSLQWIVIEQACYRCNLCTVPLYSTFGDEAVAYICCQTELEYIATTADKIDLILKVKKEKTDSKIKVLIIMDNIIEESKAKAAKELSVEMIKYSDFEKQGETILPARPPKTDDLATICYTSGTTAMPKGVMLSHGNFLAMINTFLIYVEKNYVPKLDSSEVYLSYLPLAHVFERVVYQLVVVLGAKLGFSQGDSRKVLDDVKELKPTAFVSVPRVYTRIYAGIMSKMKSMGFIANTLFNAGYAVKDHYAKQGYDTNLLFDTILFNRFKAELGGRVKILVSAAAPLSAEVSSFLRICFCCPLVEAYGQTEACGAISLTFHDDHETGHVGPPTPCCQVKLVDVPELGYTSQDKPFPRGEICAKGTNIFHGYYKDPVNTNEVLIDGWAHTGDIGLWDDKGRLKVIDRKKNIFKLSQGEYVAAEKIENILNRHSMIDQSYVYGDSLKSAIIAVIVPNPKEVMGWAKKKDIDASFEEICAFKLKDDLLTAITKFCKENQLKGFEIPRNIHIEPQSFTDQGFMTPTMKIKRPLLKERYRPIFDKLYAEIKD